jgi:hypothetical protein
VDHAITSADPNSDYGEILHAYALVESKSRPGLYYALHLKGVIAEDVEHLTPNGNTTSGAYGSERMIAAIGVRTIKKKWIEP